MGGIRQNFAVTKIEIMKYNRKKLLFELKASVTRVNQIVTGFTFVDETLLNKKPSPESWSVLECLEHLNLYGDFYLPEMEKTILEGKNATHDWYKPGVLGDYFAKSMQPKTNGTLKKMKSPKDKQPVHSTLRMTTLDRFIKQLDHLERLLEMAATSDLQQNKTPISISKWIRLRLGDTFRFYVYHIERHIAQAERALKKV